MGEFGLTLDLRTAGGVVSAYRLYRLDGSGKIDSAEWIEADGEEAAVTTARASFPDGGFELWQRQRLVRRVPRSDPSSPSPCAA